MKQRKFTTLTVKTDKQTYKKSVAYRTAAELAEKKKQFEIECERKEQPLFSDVAAEWKEEHFPTVEHYTVVAYTTTLKDLLADFGNMKIADIAPIDIQSFLDKMARQGYAKQTINVRKVVASLIFDYAIFHGYVIYNPTKVCKVPKAPKQTRTPPSKEDLERIAAAPDSFWKRYYLFLMYTGLRREEALALTKDDLDFENCTVTVNKVIIYESNAPTMRNYAKTEAGNRLAPFPTILHKYFENASKGLIFGQNGKPLTRAMFEDGLKKFRKENNIICTSHQLRHYFATMCHGVIDVKDAQHLLGHSRVQTTLDIYTTIDAQKQQDAISKLNTHLLNTI